MPAPAIQDDQLLNEKITSLYDFSRFNKIVDVGGGHVGLITSILKANPQAFGVLFGAEEVIAGAWPKLEEAAIADRCATIVGDFFKSVPAGGDAYILKGIISACDDEHAILILKNCRNQMPRNGRVIIVDSVLPEEFDELLAAADLRFLRVIPTDLPTSIIEAEPR